METPSSPATPSEQIYPPLPTATDQVYRNKFIVLPTDEIRPPIPKPRTQRSSESDVFTVMRGPAGSSSSLPSYTPSYAPPVPFPIMSGFLDKATGDPDLPLKNQSWAKRLIEVSEGTFRYFNNRAEKEDTGVVVPLPGSFVSVQARRHIRLESKSGVRIFRASSEARAYQWAFVISRYCFTAPVAEGYCMKMSGGKNVFEERYVKVGPDGVLSWYKSEKDDADCRGSILICGEPVRINPDDRSEVWIQTNERRFIFKFSDAYEAEDWIRILNYHSGRQGVRSRSLDVRNKPKK